MFRLMLSDLQTISKSITTCTYMYMQICRCVMNFAKLTKFNQIPEYLMILNLSKLDKISKVTSSRHGMKHLWG